jgi:hypothetical protein
MQTQMTQSAMNSATSNATLKLEESVRSRLNGRVQCFQLVVVSDGVILRGKALSYHAKQLAQHMVMEACSLQILANEVEVANGEAP